MNKTYHDNENSTRTHHAAVVACRGWYITEAAKAIGRDPSHVRRVLIGDRKSKTIAKLLRALPEKQLTGQRK